MILPGNFWGFNLSCRLSYDYKYNIIQSFLIIYTKYMKRCRIIKFTDGTPRESIEPVETIEIMEKSLKSL